MENQTSPNVKTAVMFFNSLTNSKNSIKINVKPAISVKPVIFKSEIKCEEKMQLCETHKSVIIVSDNIVTSNIKLCEDNNNCKNMGTNATENVKRINDDSLTCNKDISETSTKIVKQIELKNNKSASEVEINQNQCKKIRLRKRTAPLPQIKIVPVSAAQEKAKSRTYKKLLAISSVSEYCYKR